MQPAPRFPIAGMAIAFLTCAFLALLGADPVLVIGVLIVWLCSFWVSRTTPVPLANESLSPKLDREMLGEVIEDSATPFLMIDRSRVFFANNAARQIMGGHVVGQDPRVAFRQPEAIALIDGDDSSRAMIRGLVRPRDIWEMALQKLDGFSIVELVDRTTEADVSRAHTDFVANASHELRTPLASILGYVETLQDDSKVSESKAGGRFLGTIEREAKRMQVLVSDLMSLSRIEAEKHDMPAEHIALGRLIRRAAGDAAGENRGERLVFSLAEDVDVPGDAQQLEQLVRNLVENALRYGDQDKPVTVSLETSSNGMAELIVADEGDGIDPQHIPHLTRRFYRTDPGRSRASGGTGLGLAIVKHIVERHRGRIDIKSSRGQGTSVSVRIPLASSETAISS